MFVNGQIIKIINLVTLFKPCLHTGAIFKKRDTFLFGDLFHNIFIEICQFKMG